MRKRSVLAVAVAVAVGASTMAYSKLAATATTTSWTFNGTNCSNAGEYGRSAYHGAPRLDFSFTSVGTPGGQMIIKLYKGSGTHINPDQFISSNTSDPGAYKTASWSIAEADTGKEFYFRVNCQSKSSTTTDAVLQN